MRVTRAKMAWTHAESCLNVVKQSCANHVGIADAFTYCVERRTLIFTAIPVRASRTLLVMMPQ